MDNILKSASKIVFISLSLTACVAFLYGAFTADPADGLPVDQFMLLAVAASSFYFSNKGEASEPYAGK